MGQVFHGSATTTEATRRAIQHSLFPVSAHLQAAPVRSSLLPCDVMKSMLTATFFLAVHSSINYLVELLASGTQ
jgi:hypothetical protein